MSRPIVFDVRFKNQAGVGQSVDNSIYADFFEEGNDTKSLTRQLGSDPNLSIYKTTDAEGVVYTTTLDGSLYTRGSITVKWYAQLNGSPVSPYPYIETQSNIFGDNELSVGNIKTYIRSMLGFPAVSVELTGPHYTSIVEEALSLYSQHIPAERVVRLAYQPSVQVYKLPQIPYNGPFDVKFVRKVINPIASDPLFGREYLRSNEPDLGTLMIGQAYLETALRVVSSEPDWRWLHETKELYINIGPGISSQVYGGYDVSVRYFAPVTLNMVREDHFRWFKRYCLAQSKKVLGQIRGKYSGNVPAPGGPLQLNYTEMMQQGDQEEATLVEELKNMAPHVPPMFG